VRLNESPQSWWAASSTTAAIASPSHSNKDGVRYRYYVSHVLLQRRNKDAGPVVRVPAIQLVVEAIQAKAWAGTEPKGGLSDREVIDRYVMRFIVRPTRST
jgi:hypothetical protein